MLIIKDNQEKRTLNEPNGNSTHRENGNNCFIVLRQYYFELSVLCPAKLSMKITK